MQLRLTLHSVVLQSPALHLDVVGALLVFIHPPFLLYCLHILLLLVILLLI